MARVTMSKNNASRLAMQMPDEIVASASIGRSSKARQRQRNALHSYHLQIVTKRCPAGLITQTYGAPHHFLGNGMSLGVADGRHCDEYQNGYSEETAST